jgi:hypothetical protein
MRGGGAGFGTNFQIAQDRHSLLLANFPARGCGCARNQHFDFIEFGDAFALFAV